MLWLLASASTFAQTTYIQNATIHIGNGKVIPSGLIGFEKDKIVYVGTGDNIRLNANEAKIIDGSGKHVYPGLIALNTTAGLNEIDAVRATRDYTEVGMFNPHVRSIIAFNTDSKILPTLRHNGIMYVEPVPQGDIITGRSSLMATQGWNWEDAALASDAALHLNWPSLTVWEAPWMPSADEQRKKSEEALKQIKNFFNEAKVYFEGKQAETNLKFEALRPFMLQQKIVFIHADDAKAITTAVLFAAQYGLKAAIVGGAEAHLVIDLLKTNKVAVVLSRTHRLPYRNGDDIDLPYKQPAILMKAGIAVALTSDDGAWQQRNLPFNAGTAAAYGLTEEEALQTITQVPAQLFGVDQLVGTLENGKIATLLLTSGNLLDMKTSNVELAFINGMPVNLENQQQQLYQKYRAKYGLNK